MQKQQDIDLIEISNERLWLLHAETAIELKKRKLIRTRNTVGERGEFLAIETYNKTPGLPNLLAAPEGTQNIDAISRKGDRYSIKTITDPGAITGVFYGLGDKEQVKPEKKFEYVIIVQIFNNYLPKRILELTFEQFLKFRKWHSTMRAWNLRVSADLLKEAKIILDNTTD